MSSERTSMRSADSIERDSIERDKSRYIAPQKTGKMTSKIRPGSAERIKPWRWKKGCSGNPGGRPKNDLARDIAQAIFENSPEAIYKAFCKSLLKGNAYTFKELAERAFGKRQNPKKSCTSTSTRPIKTCRRALTRYSANWA